MSVSRKTMAAASLVAVTAPVATTAIGVNPASAAISCATTNVPTKGFGGVGGSTTFQCGVAPNAVVVVKLLESPSGDGNWTTVASTGTHTLAADPLTLTAFHQYPTPGRWYKTEAYMYVSGMGAGDWEDSAPYLYKV